MTPQQYYSERSSEIQNKLLTTSRIVARLSWLRIILALVIVVLMIAAVKYSYTALWVAVGLAIVGFFFLLRLHHRYQKLADYYKAHHLILDAELKSLNGDNSSFAAGQEYIDPSHPYSYDLDIFGKGSIYQLLCRTVTRKGDLLLADMLKQPYGSLQQIAERQAINKELSSMPAFMEHFRTSGSLHEEVPGDMNKIRNWLDGDDDFINKPYWIVLAIIIPLISTGLIVYSIIAGQLYAGLIYLIIFNLVILRITYRKTNYAYQLISKSVQLIDKYESLLSVIAAQNFNTPRLAKISVEARTSNEQIVRFRKLAHLFDSRQNGMVGPLMNVFFLFDIYCMLRLEAWRRKNKQVLLHSFYQVPYMDIYISLATYTFNYPETIHPAIDIECKFIKTSNLQHPLLPAAFAIGNDFSLGKNEQLYLLTGANMTGKSTFIRTLGVSVIMAYLGLPLRAAACTLPLLNIYTSIRITDSVQNDVSYFKAELNRMQKLLSIVQTSGDTCLILMDEPLKGTNSTDKQLGTQAIMEKLLQNDALGIVATHDTGLCKLEAMHPGLISNYHFESEVVGAELRFDYKLKHGCSTSNNATILMKLMQII